MNRYERYPKTVKSTLRIFTNCHQTKGSLDADVARYESSDGILQGDAGGRFIINNNRAHALRGSIEEDMRIYCTRFFEAEFVWEVEVKFVSYLIWYARLKRQRDGWNYAPRIKAYNDFGQGKP